MIQVLMAERGTGKSKHMISDANKAIENSKGNIVFIDDDMRPMHELDRSIRFISAENYEINNFCSLYGFVCGILAQDYDVDQIYIDGVMKNVDLTCEKAEEDFNKIIKLSDDNKITIFLSINVSNDTPDYLKKYKKEI